LVAIVRCAMGDFHHVALRLGIVSSCDGNSGTIASHESRQAHGICGL
jgi:hypothetical protein